MATPTYEPIQTYTLSTTQSSVTFSSISGYTDLVLVANPIISGGTAYNLQGWFNSDNAGTSYSATRLSGTGSGSGSSDNVPNYPVLLFSGAVKVQTTYGSQFIIQIQNYANTSTFKTVLCRSSNAATGVDAIINTWRSTAAVTSFSVRPEVSTFAAGSTFTLYGIANADIGAKATGGVITYDSTYYYHTFGASGTFTPQQNLTNVDYLVIAGGGGGGNSDQAGGGGAGGLRSTVTATGGGGSLESKLSLTSSTAYTITVGAGGSAASNGVNSSIAGSGLTTITATGGGAGGQGGISAGASGGSGGGGGWSQIGGTGTANQGYAGGTASVTNQNNSRGAAGGGGAGAIGGNLVPASTSKGTPANAGSGGAGVSIPEIANTTGTGVATYYAGGGGGGALLTSDGWNTTAGTGGLGGGGNGRQDSAAGSAGIVNTGGGGGGSAINANTGLAGGSGLVVIRYAKA
jgi:hypothetical protein